MDWICVYIKYKVRLQGKEGSKNRELFLLAITNQELEGWSSVKVSWQGPGPDRISQNSKILLSLSQTLSDVGGTHLCLVSISSLPVGSLSPTLL